MPNTFDSLTSLDATIAAGMQAAGMLDTMTLAGEEIEGYFNQSLQTAGADDEEHTFKVTTFDCRADALPAEVATDTELAIAGAGTFRYLYRQNYGVGRTIVYLGDPADG